MKKSTNKYIHFRINELLAENNIPKTRLYKELDLQFTNMKKYHNDSFHTIDPTLIIGLCEFFKCSISDLLEIRERPVESDTDKKLQTVFKPIRTKP